LHPLFFYSSEEELLCDTGGSFAGSGASPDPAGCGFPLPFRKKGFLTRGSLLKTLIDFPKSGI